MLWRFKKIHSKICSISVFLKNMIKNGGVAYANVAQISYGGMLEGKTVLVTGGASGIGLSVAKKIISEGGRVIITGRSKDNLDKAVQEINSDRVFPIEWDVSCIEIIDEKLREVKDSFGTIDILVNNAGVLLGKSFPNVSEKVWDVTYSTNSKGLFFLTQAIAKDWIDNKRKGKIINISSTSGFYGAVNPYGLSKWDVVGFTEGIAKMLLPKGIIVNGIAPGRTATSMLGKSDSKNIYDSRTLPKRFGLPEEIAELATFLMSDATNFIVGQTIVCDGGYTLDI